MTDAPTSVGKAHPMLKVVSEPSESDRTGEVAGSPSLIDEIVREGARRMLAEALQAEVDAYIAQFIEQRDRRGRRLVVPNGSRQPREVVTSAGAIEVTAPRSTTSASTPRPASGSGFLGDPAALVPEDPKDQRGAAAALPARTVDG